MKILFISDFYVENGVSGGAELVDQEITNLLSTSGIEVDKINSHRVNIDFINGGYDSFIISNFTNLSEQIKQELINNKNYLILEHDHKYIKSRNPADYLDGCAPSYDIKNYDFYKSAQAVFCQTKLHCKLLRKNILLNNIVNLTSSVWSEEELNILESASKNEKIYENAVIYSENPIKNTELALGYCERNQLDYTLIQPSDFSSFIEMLSKSKNLIFFPSSYESCCRVLVEARMLQCSLTTNDMSGALSEEWINLSGMELINHMREKKKEVLNKIQNSLKGDHDFFFKEELPKVSIITSVFNGDEHIEGFMQNIVNQTYYDNCELILIDCNSPGNEKEVIEEYSEKYNNIIYERLDKDPGIYGAWNIAIEKAKGEYITNANLDDRRSNVQVETLVRYLENYKEIGLTYSENFITKFPNETFEFNSSNFVRYPSYEYSRENMIKCLPGPMPIWRASLHKDCGFFNEKMKYAGDWDMWLRFVRKGYSFKKVPGTHGLYYDNPQGLSTTREIKKSSERHKEECSVFWEYTDVFGPDMTNKFLDHFKR